MSASENDIRLGAGAAASPLADRGILGRRGGLDVASGRPVNGYGAGRWPATARHPHGGVTRSATGPLARPASRRERTKPARVIVVVDDERLIREFMRLLLARAGFTVLVAADGLEALEVIRRRNVDLVITDVNMPRLGGCELAQRVRAQRPELPVLFMSGNSILPGLEAFAQDRAAGFLPKPFSPPALYAKVEALLGGARSPASAAAR